MPTERSEFAQDPADDRPDTTGELPAADPGRFTPRGEQAETAAFEGEGAYSGGGFAGGEPDQEAARSRPSHGEG